jgi:phosphatidate cytidylyltransferase
MLKQRVITALLMLAVLLPALFYPSPEPFCALTLLLIVAACWEWARLNGCSSVQGWGLGVAVGACLALSWWQVGFDEPLSFLWKAGALWWLLLTPLLLYRGVAGWGRLAAGLRLWGGLAVIALAWWAMAQARYMGIDMLLSVLLLVWMADVAAYFGGKAFGRRKLAPNISPGKSWAGVYSGLLGVLLLGLAWVWVAPPDTDPVAHSLYAHLWTLGPVAMVLGLVLLTAMSVSGDLIESLVKRSAGVKDSSALLPGHGGVLDRVDALLPVLPVAMMLVTW